MKKLIFTGFFIALIVPSLSFAAFDTSLKYGAKGGAVSELQEFLTDQGVYSGPITGNFFALTLKAVKAWQTANKVPSTGFFGPLSRTRANELLSLTESDDAEVAETGSIGTPFMETPAPLVVVQNPIPVVPTPEVPVEKVNPIVISNFTFKSEPADGLKQSAYTPIETIEWTTSIPTRCTITIWGKFGYINYQKEKIVSTTNENMLATNHSIVLKNNVLEGSTYTFTVDAISGNYIDYSQYKGSFTVDTSKIE